MIRLFRRRAFYGPAVRVLPRSATLRFELLEDRSTPAATGATFTANAFGGGTFAPFANTALEVRSTSGDVNGDGIADIITATGPGIGSGSEIRIFDGRAAQAGQVQLIADFYAYSNTPGASQTPGFDGGIFVAAADLNGDGRAEVITSPGAGASGHVKVFDFNDGSGGFLGSDPTLRASFFAYPGFEGEVRVATLDPGNGQAPFLVTASGAGTTQSDLRLYSNAFNIGQVNPGALVNPASQQFLFPGYLGGVSIAGGSNGQLFVAPNTGSSSISTFNLNSGGTGTGTLDGTTSLLPGNTFQTGFASPTDLRLGTADVNGDGTLDVLASSVGSNSATPISAFSPTDEFASLNALNGFSGFGFFGGSWLGSSDFTGVFPSATTTGTSLGTTGTTGISGTGTSSGGSSGSSGFGSVTSQGLFGLSATQGLSGSGSLGSSALTSTGTSYTATGGAFNYVTSNGLSTSQANQNASSSLTSL